MSLTTHERHGLYPAIFDALTVNHIRSVSPSPAVEQMLITPGGAVDPALVAEAFQDPTCDLKSGDLSILGAVSPLAGLSISSTGEIQYQARFDGGTFQGVSSHITLNSIKGFLGVQSVRAEQDAQAGAEIALKYWALKSGSNPPFAINTGQSLTGSPTALAIYRLGPVVYEGSKIGGIKSAGMTTNLEFGTKRAGGATAADVGSILERKPIFEIDGTNLTLAAGVGFGRTAISAGTTIYFEKVGAAPSSAVHISFTISGGDYVLKELPVSGKEDANCQLLVTAAGSQMTYSTTAVIP